MRVCFHMFVHMKTKCTDRVKSLQTCRCAMAIIYPVNANNKAFQILLLPISSVSLFAQVQMDGLLIAAIWELIKRHS